MTPILSALAQGFVPKKILDYLKKNFPALQSPITKALATGYSAEKILGFLSGSGDLEQEREQGASPNKIEALRKQGYNKNIGRVAGAATSFIPLGGLLGTTAPTATLPNPSTGPQPMGGAPVHPQQGPNLGLPAQIPAQAPGPTPQGPNLGAQPQIPTQGTAQTAIAPNLAAFTQDPEFKAFVQKKIDNGTEGPLEQMIKEFKIEKKKSPMMKGILEQAEQMKKNDFITPSGDVGTLKSERNGKVLVDINGKLEQFNKKDLEAPSQELFDVVEKMLDLPEIEKSSVISSLIYRPAKKEMFVKYHTGDSYVYEDVSPEEMQPIADAIGIPVTSGQTVYGAWEKGKQDSRGAALITGIIKNAKYSKDQQGKTWEKLETKYDRYKKLYKQTTRKRKGQE